MSTTDTRSNDATAMAKDATVDMKLEVVMIPVSDVERAKQFYESLGWRLDGDFRTDTSRGLQFTPKGSGCSIQFGTNVTSAEPGSAEGLHLIVSDIEAAHEALASRGVEVSEIDDQPWGSFVYFSDPDGNGWSVQQIQPRGGR